MAGPKTYVGVSSKARQVKNIYVGVSSKARKVKKVYAGVGGKARLVYSADFWLPTGITNSDVIAAYQFKGATSESASRTDRSGHSKTLTLNSGSSSWTNANGYYLNGGYLFCTSLYDISNLNSFVIRYSGMNQTTNTYIGTLLRLCYVGNSSGSKPIFLPRMTYNTTVSGKAKVYKSNNPGVVVGYSNNKLNYYRATQMLPANGVIGYSSGTFYINGSAVGTEYISEAAETLYTTQLGDTNSNGLVCYAANGYGFTVIAETLFSKSLTAAQQKEVADAMNLL